MATSDVGAVADAVTALTKALAQRDAEANTPAEQVAAENAAIQALYDKYVKAVETKDLDAIRKNIAASPNTGP